MALNPDLDQAQKYLRKLGGDRFTFQTFDDHQPKDRKLARIFYGTLLQHWESLVDLNRRGAGVFVTVQKTDGHGRTLDHIIGVRALFQEDDGDGQKLPIPPQMVVETSPGKYHRYLLVKNCPSPEAWSEVQNRIVQDFGSDPGAKDLARVLRVPGFYHQKGQPHMVRVKTFSPRGPYHWGDLASLLPPAPKPPRKKLNGHALTKEPARIYSALRYLDPDMAYEDWMTILMAINSADSSDDGLMLADEWSAEGRKYVEGEVRRKWDSMTPHGGVGVGSLYHMAYEAGWDGSYELDDRGKAWLKIEEEHHLKIKVRSPRGRPLEQDDSIPEGLIKDLAEWSKRRAYIQQPVFDLGVALLGTALLSGNRYHVAGWNTPLQPYLMFSVMTGGGKDHMRRCISDIVSEARLGDVLSSGYQSAHALFDQLAEGANMVCWLLDEAAEHLKNGLKPGSQDRAVVAHILSLYGLGTGRFEGFRGRRQTVEPIDRPFVLLGASAQPGPLGEVAGLEYVGNGMLSRFLLLEGSKHKLVRNRMRVTGGLSKFQEAFDKFRGVALGTEIQFGSGQVGQRIEDFADEALERSVESDHHAIWTRANQNALIVAGLLAVSQDQRRPVINDEIWDYAQSLSVRSITSWLDLIGNSGGATGGDESRAMQRIKYLLTDKQASLKYMRDGSEKRVFDEGWVSRRALMRGLSARVRKRGFDDALDWLKEEGSVIQGQFGRLKVYRWVHQ